LRIVPLLQWREMFSNPSWKVIVSASRGQYLKPGSSSPAFFWDKRSAPRRKPRRLTDSAPAIIIGQ
jgi:hypothetical protein